MRRARAAFCVVLCVSASTVAQELTESTDFPNDLPGPMAVQMRGGCFLLASGTIEPGDVDWVGVTVPFPSDRTVVDVDFSAGSGRSYMLMVDQSGSTFFAMADNNNPADNLCGLGSGTDPVGDTADSVVDMGPTNPDVVIDVAITGSGDFGFSGGHNESFDYEVWVYAGEPDAGCVDDAECDDGVDCTVDSCDQDSGECSSDPEDSFCDNDSFCDGAEVCDADQGCVDGEPPCAGGMECDEEAGDCLDPAPSVALDVRPGACRNSVNSRGRGTLQVALLGSDSFDVSDVDRRSVVLVRTDGVGQGARPLRGRGGARRTDVGEPVYVESDCECVERNPDGVPDLMFKFGVNALSRAFRMVGSRRTATVEVTLHGTLRDGTKFEVSDCVSFIPLGRPNRSRR